MLNCAKQCRKSRKLEGDNYEVEINKVREALKTCTVHSKTIFLRQGFHPVSERPFISIIIVLKTKAE